MTVIPDEKDEMGIPDYIRAGQQAEEPETVLPEDAEEPGPEIDLAEDIGEQENDLAENKEEPDRVNDLAEDMKGPAETEERQEWQPVSDSSGQENEPVSEEHGPAAGEPDVPKPPRYHADLLPLESAGAKTRFGWNMDAVYTALQRFGFAGGNILEMARSVLIQRIPQKRYNRGFFCF